MILHLDRAELGRVASGILDKAHGLRVDLDPEVAPRTDLLVEVSHSSTRALAVPDCKLLPADADGVAVVVVLVERPDTGLLSCGEGGLEDPLVDLVQGDADGSRVSVKLGNEATTIVAARDEILVLRTIRWDS